MSVSIRPGASWPLAYLPKAPLLYLSVASLLNFGIADGNEYLIQKVKKSAFIKISLLYTLMDRVERKLVISVLLGTRLSTGPRALCQYAFESENLLGIAARCPRVHLVLVEKITCDVRI